MSFQEDKKIRYDNPEIFDSTPTWIYIGKKVMERFFEPFVIRQDVKYLEMGSGTGRVIRNVLIPKGVNPENITGIEINSDRFGVAKKLISGVNFILGDISSVNMPLDFFDVVYSDMVFEHLDDMQFISACNIAYNTLKSGGIFGFLTTHPSRMVDEKNNPVTTYGRFLTKTPWDESVPNWRRSIQDFRTILKNIGFRNITFQEIKFTGTEDQSAFEKYSKFSAVRLFITAEK